MRQQDDKKCLERGDYHECLANCCGGFHRKFGVGLDHGCSVFLHVVCIWSAIGGCQPVELKIHFRGAVNATAISQFWSGRFRNVARQLWLFSYQFIVERLRDWRAGSVGSFDREYFLTRDKWAVSVGSQAFWWNENHGNRGCRCSTLVLFVV